MDLVKLTYFLIGSQQEYLWSESQLGFWTWNSLNFFVIAYFVIGLTLRKHLSPTPLLNWLNRQLALRNWFTANLRRVLRCVVRALAWPFSPVSAVLLIALVQFLFISLGERTFVDYDADKLGVMVARFGGADLTDEFGTLGVSNKIKRSLQKLSVGEAVTPIEVHASNHEFSTQQEAWKWAVSQGAKIVIWGYADNVRDSIVAEISYSMPTAVTQDCYSHGCWIGATIPERTSFPLSANSKRTRSELDSWLTSIASVTLARNCFETGDFVGASRYIEGFHNAWPTPTRGDVLAYELLRLKALSGQSDWRAGVLINSSLDSLMWEYVNDPSVSDSTRDVDTKMSSQFKYTAGLWLHVGGDRNSALSRFNDALSTDKLNVFAASATANYYASVGDWRAAIVASQQYLMRDSLITLLFFNQTKILDIHGMRNSPKSKIEMLCNAYQSLLDLMIVGFAALEMRDSVVSYATKASNAQLPTGSQATAAYVIALLELAKADESATVLLSEAHRLPCLLRLIGQLYIPYSKSCSGKLLDELDVARKASSKSNLDYCTDSLPVPIMQFPGRRNLG